MEAVFKLFSRIDDDSSARASGHALYVTYVTLHSKQNWGSFPATTRCLRIARENVRLDARLPRSVRKKSNVVAVRPQVNSSNLGRHLLNEVKSEPLPVSYITRETGTITPVLH
jgi:hypothetical protein